MDETARASVLSDLLDGVGSVLWRLDRDEEALTAFREATRLNPDDARTWVGLALTTFGLSRFGEAVTAWERALRIDPSYFDRREDERRLWEASLRADREVQVTVIPFRPGRPIYVSARINGTGLVRLILDTGAVSDAYRPAGFCDGFPWPRSWDTSDAWRDATIA
jgi:tetratricopeptide (TPR) repeat protein